MPIWTVFIDPDAPEGRFLPWREVKALTGLSRTTAWRLQKAGDFPQPYVISPGRVGYLQAEVEAWRASRRHRGAGESCGRIRPFQPTPAPGPPQRPVPGAASDADGQASRAPPSERRDKARRPHAPRPRHRPAVDSAQQITFDF